jgi:hypothetical protein
MGASTIYFNGRVITRPGAYSEVDASGLESVGLGASGIVALVGTAVGGKPYSAVDQSDTKGNLQTTSSPQKARGYYQSGDLKEAAQFAFAPGADEDIPGGAAEIVHVKVNPSAPSTAGFDNSDGQSLVLTSEDWGFRTTQISVQIANGTTQGKLITIVLEDVEEVFDDVGGDDIFTLQYLSSTPADGFTTITAEVTTSALVCAMTRTQIGLDSEVTNQVTTGQVIEMVSSDAGDVGVQVRIYGTDGSDAAQSEVVVLNGASAVDTVATWNSFHGVEVISGVLAGTLTLRNDGGGTTIATIAPAGTEAAAEFLIDMPVANSALTYVADAASTARITVWGLSTAGAFQIETKQLNGATPVAGTATWSRIDGLALGELAAARTLTVSGNAVNLQWTNYPTIQKLADKVNSLAGFTLTIVVSNPTAYPSASLDWLAATDIKSAASASVLGDLYAIIVKINASSALVTAEAGSVASGPPDNTSDPVFLAGGHEGSAVSGSEGTPTATNTDWQNAFDLLKKVRVNTVVPLTGTPAIHAMAKAHAEWGGGIGRSERDVVVGLQNTGLTDVPTKTEIKAQILDLNSRHVRACAQAIERYDTNGDRTEFQPPFQAAVIAGMQAGSPVGTPLTSKVANVLKLRQDSSWNPTDDDEELLQAGLLFMEVVDNVGRRVVRNVTTHLSSSNIAYTEGSVNEATNYAVYNFRTTMERMVGKAGFAGTARAAEALATNILGLLIGVALVAWRSLDVQLILDVIQLAVEIAPVIPVNFVENNIHLVAIPQSAAAA